jgi:hypothetical protein
MVYPMPQVVQSPYTYAPCYVPAAVPVPQCPPCPKRPCQN